MAKRKILCSANNSLGSLDCHILVLCLKSAKKSYEFRGAYNKGHSYLWLILISYLPTYTRILLWQSYKRRICNVSWKFSLKITFEIFAQTGRRVEVRNNNKIFEDYETLNGCPLDLPKDCEDFLNVKTFLKVNV